MALTCQRLWLQETVWSDGDEETLTTPSLPSVDKSTPTSSVYCYSPPTSKVC